VAIVITLIYLAIQTQQNTQALQAAARLDSMNAEVEMLYQFLAYPPGSILEVTGSTREEYQELMLYSAMFNLRRNMWLQYKNGAMDRETWEPYERSLVSLLGPGSPIRKAWDNGFAGSIMSPDFREEINALVEAAYPASK